MNRIPKCSTPPPVSSGREWCVDSRLNIVHTCVDKRSRDTRPAIKWEGEDGSRSEVSYRELAHEVNRAANALFTLGLRKGDVVALFMPMLPETAIAVFAVAKIGGIVLPLFSGYGPDALRHALSIPKRSASSPVMDLNVGDDPFR